MQWQVLKGAPVNISNPVKVTPMVCEGKARFFKNSQGRYMIYLPVDLCEDSMFPFKVTDSMHVQVDFKQGDNKLTIAAYKKPEEQKT